MTSPNPNLSSNAAIDPATKAALQGLISGSRQLNLPCNLSLPTTNGLWPVQAHQQLRLLPAQRWVVAVNLGEHLGVRLGDQAATPGDAQTDANIDPLQGLLKIFVGPKAQRHHARELAAVKRLASSGVTTPALIEQGAWAQGADGATSYYLLYAWVQGRVSGPAPSQDEFCRIVEAVAQLHSHGLQQTDMHLANFLLAEDRVYAVDASDIHELPSAAKRTAAALENLAVLFAQQQVAGARVQMPAWVDAYQRGSNDPSINRAPELTHQMQQLTHQQRYQRVRRYLHKSLRDCTEFHVEKSTGRRFICVRESLNSGFATFAQNPEAVMAQGQVLKAGNTATVVRAQIDGQTVVIKRYNIKHWRHRAAQSLRRTGRALRAWHNALRLHFLGIPTAQPLALLETWRGPLRDTAYLVLADLGDNDLLHAVQSSSAAQQWAQPLARLMQDLRWVGFVHGDTKATNFIIHNNRLHVIDLDALRDVTPTGKQWQQHAGFGKDRARLLRNWQQQADIVRILESALP